MKNRNKNNRVFPFIITLIIIVFILCMCPLDIFTHGNYIDSIDLENINAEDIKEKISLEKGTYTGEFIPAKRHFTGFGLCLVDFPQGSVGRIIVSIIDSDRNILDIAQIELSKIVPQNWYRVYLDVNLKPGDNYFYTIEAENCSVYPSLQKVDEAYLSNESIDGNDVLIGYMYSQSTLSFSEKTLLGILLFLVWLFIVNQSMFNQRQQKYVSNLLLIILMTFGMSWNFMYNTLDSENDGFVMFQSDSEALVTGAIYAEQNNVPLNSYGLYRYEDLLGVHMTHGLSFLTDDNWIHGYSKLNPQILISNTDISKQVSMPGNYIRFSNGDIFQISTQEEIPPYLIITLAIDHSLNYYKYGDIADAIFLNSEMQILDTKAVTTYYSQYGLQGKVFRSIARYIKPEVMLEVLNLICCILAGLTFAVIVFFIWKKYNALMAECFFVVFLLSPWIVNFARNLYWVEFTWFIPMATGLFCSLYINNKKCRFLSYIITFFSIIGKCLCGYEYVSTIMLGLIVFLLGDIVKSFIGKDKHQVVLLIKTTFILGCVALTGFVCAICIHANLRGEGNIIEGVKSIIQNDVLRRAFGGDVNQFDPVLWDSINASSWQVFKTYFHFNTEVIGGIKGNLFPLLCIIPLIIFIYNYKNKKIDWEDMTLYVISFLTSISWYILGKQHSYVHTHMNYVLWYFGYIQICFYIICKQIVRVFHGEHGNERKI